MAAEWSEPGKNRKCKRGFYAWVNSPEQGFSANSQGIQTADRGWDLVSHKFTPDWQAAENRPIVRVPAIGHGHDADAAGEVGKGGSACITGFSGICWREICTSGNGAQRQADLRTGRTSTTGHWAED